jgi:hypothetical protein
MFTWPRDEVHGRSWITPVENQAPRRDRAFSAVAGKGSQVRLGEIVEERDALQEFDARRLICHAAATLLEHWSA